jgi:hypothetical protein
MADLRACVRCNYGIQIGPDAVRNHRGRGLCNFCYDAIQRAGALIDFERLTRSCDEVMAEWAILRQQGYTKRQAAERLGMKFKAFEKAYERARRAGDPRAVPAAQYCPRISMGPRGRSGVAA